MAQTVNVNNSPLLQSMLKNKDEDEEKDDYSDILDDNNLTPVTMNDGNQLAKQVPSSAPKRQANVSEDNNEESQSRSPDGNYVQPSVSDIIGKLKGEVNPDRIEAMRLRNNLQLISSLGQAGNTILGGATHTQLDQTPYLNMMKMAGQPLEDLNEQDKSLLSKLQQQEAAQKISEKDSELNPESPNNELNRNIFQLSGMPEDQIPENLIHNKDELDAWLKYQEILKRSSLIKPDKTKENQEFRDFLDKRTKLVNLNKQLSEDMATGRTAFGKAAQNKQLADNAIALLEGNIKKDDIPPQQVYEVARVMDRILSGGQPTDSSTGHLTPETADSWLANKMQFVNNEVTGAKAAKFLDFMEKGIGRERNQAMKQIMATKSEMIPAMTFISDEPKLKPYWDAMLKSKGLDPEWFTDNKVHRVSTAPKIKQFPMVVKDENGNQATVKNADELKEANSEGFH